MKENLIEVLMYLFENHMHENSQINLNEESLLNELKNAGFDVSEIHRALDWLNGLEEISKLESIPANSFRALSPFEQELLDAECWGFILFLEHVKILTPLTREVLIDRLLEFAPGKVALGQVKWVTLMVLFNQKNHRDALQAMETLILADEPSRPQ